MSPKVSSGFRVSVAPDGALILRGELDMATVQDLQDTIDHVIVPGRRIVFDMAQLTFMDSSAINCMIRICVQTGHPVMLRDASPGVRRVLDLLDARDPSGAWVFEAPERSDRPAR